MIKKLNILSKRDKIKLEKNIPRSMVELEDFYNLKDRFKMPTNWKMNGSTMIFEIINLGIDKNPQILN